MKQSVSPAVIGIVAVVAILVIGFIGYRVFAGGAQDPGAPSEAAQAQRMKDAMGKYSGQAGGPPNANSGVNRRMSGGSYGGGQYQSGSGGSYGGGGPR